MRKKIRRKYDNASMAGKMMITFSLFLVIFCLISQLVLQGCLTVYDGKLYEKSLQELDYFTQEVNRSLEEIEDLTGSIAMDDEVQEQLTEILWSKEADASYLLGILNLRDLIGSYTNANNQIRSITFYDKKFTDFRMGRGIDKLPEEIRAEMKEELEQARGGVVSRNPQEDWGYYVISRNVLEKAHTRLTYLGTIALSCDVSAMIRKNVRNLEAEHASLYVYTDDYQIYQDEESPKIQLPECKEGKGYEIVRKGSERYFVCWLYSQKTGWMYVNAFPYTEIYGQIQIIRLLLLGTVLVLAVLFVVGMKKMIGTITSPLQELTQTMKIVETGKFQEARESLQIEERADEIGQLQQEFDTMLEQIDELIRENYEKQILLKDTSYRMLRAQINPHFIYNTLNTINWMVKWKKNEEVSRLITEFGRLLRSSFAKDPFATAKEEVECTEGYMAIQSYRYQRRADFQVEKSGNLEQYYVPRMILQPLVENAIYYGIENSLEGCQIRVKVQEQENDLLFEVEDTGPGMDAETLQQVRNGTVKARGNGIGIANIRERLRLLYPEFTFEIESEQGKGTLIRIQIPKEIPEGGRKHVQTSDRR